MTLKWNFRRGGGVQFKKPSMGGVWIFSGTTHWRRGGLMVSALDSGASGPGSSPGWGHCVVFLGKILYSYSASLHPGELMGTVKLNAGG